MSTAATQKVQLQPVPLPPLAWFDGTVHQILAQPGENFFVFTMQDGSGKSAILRIANPHSGAPLPGVTEDNIIYDLMKEAYLRNLKIEVGYRDFGPDAQSGIHNLCIDRVSFSQ